MGEPVQDPNSAARQSWSDLALIAVLVGCILSIPVVFVWVAREQDSRVEDVKRLAVSGARAERKLNALADSVRERRCESISTLRRSRALVAKNPQIIPGISKAVWDKSFSDQQASIDGQAQTLRALGHSQSCE